MKGFAVAIMAGAMLLATSAGATCFEEAGAQYNVNPELLRGMAKVESSMRPDAINLTHEAHTKSVDLGLMQINSRWLPALSKNNITKEDLLKDPCLNVKVGAWILADNMRRHGPNWTAVGAYNAACTQLKGDDCDKARMVYAGKVWRAINGKQQVQPAKQLASVVNDIKHSRIASLDIPDAAPVGVVEASSHE